MSDLSGIGYFAALVFLGSIFIAFLKGIIDLSKNRKKQPKTSVSEPIINNESEEDRELSREDSEGDGVFLDDPLFPPDFND